MNRRIQTMVYGFMLFVMPAGTTLARDRLATGYTATSGIFAGLWVAQEAKLFEKYEIDSNPVLIPTASRMVQSMLGGDVAFSGAGGNAAVEATLAGGDFIMVGSLAKVPAFYIMANPEIKTIEDLRGKAVGVTRFGSSTDFTIRYVLKKHGLEPGKDVTIIQMGDLIAAALAMKNHTIVAAPFSSPANVKAQEIGAKVLLNMGSAGIYFPHDAWMARKSFINTHEDLVRRFLKAYSEGVKRLHSDPEIARRAIVRYVRASDPKVVNAVYQYAVDYIDKVPYNTREGIQEVLNQIGERNPKAKEAKAETFYDDRFVKELDNQGFYKQLWK
ncbi:MAG TPA: ABC transporter substrate-binding protein [Candidatus Binatus sp.]|nr:ABC transporter substrate-binding protein [Candidatus Binatus sp.]